MSVVNVIGVVVGKNNATREFMRDGRRQTMDVINVQVADIDGQGTPVGVDVTDLQYRVIAMWKQYHFPVEVRTFAGKSGAVTVFKLAEDYEASRALIVGNNSITPPATSSASK